MKKISKHVTEVPCKNGCTVLFSFDKPVAAYVPKQGYFRTATQWHLTTSKHIRKWLQSKNTHAKRVNDLFFNSLLEV